MVMVLPSKATAMSVIGWVGLVGRVVLAVLEVWRPRRKPPVAPPKDRQDEIDREINARRRARDGA
jgi:hypothetical protein